MEVEGDRCDRDGKALGSEKNAREPVRHAVTLPPVSQGALPNTRAAEAPDLLTN
jgi:hypothetical protein